LCRASMNSARSGRRSTFNLSCSWIPGTRPGKAGEVDRKPLPRQ
jgi:hypothetical protein